MTDRSLFSNSTIRAVVESEDPNLTSSNNVTSECVYEDTGESTVAPLVSLMILTLGVVVGNGLVILSVWINPNLRAKSILFILNLSFCDISSVLPCASGLIVTQFNRLLHSTMACLLPYCCYVLCACASVNGLILVTLDRYILISKPLKHDSVMTMARLCLGIAAGWVLALITALLPYFGWRKDKLCSKCAIEVVFADSYMIVIFFGIYLLPVLVMSVAYTKVAYIALKHLREIRMQEGIADRLRKEFAAAGSSSTSGEVGGQPCPNPPRGKKANDLRMTKTLLIIMGFFAFSWLPFFVMLLLIVRGISIEWLNNIAWFLPMLNSVINPWIYAYRLKEFKKTFHSLFRCTRPY